MDGQSLIDKHKNKILNIIILIIAVIIAFKIYNSQLAKAEQLKKDIQTESNKNEVLNDLVGLEGRLENYKNQFTRKESREFMNKINTLAKQNGLTIVSIKPRTEELKNDYSRIAFDLTVNVRNYHDLGRFINNIENNADIYRLDSAEVVAGDDNKLSANLIISSIVYTE
ncbi:MAG: type 4a pilus biogenesis protein PilO [Candidatus Omnitrophica bacterium]|nr:type 4a pilus biogenesis protein PilO [Candidatus Omnitrophota bacterium]